MWVLVGLSAYTTVYYSKALEEYERVPSELNLWTCYLLSLIAPADAMKVDINPDPTGHEFRIIRYDGEEIIVRIPTYFLVPMCGIEDHLKNYIIDTPIQLDVYLDDTFITNLLKELEQELATYMKTGGGTIYRCWVEDKRKIALAIEPLLLKKEWAKQWQSFQKRYAKATSERRFCSMSSGRLLYKIWDTCNDFHFEMSSTFAEHDNWFPNAIVKSPKEPQFV